MVLTGGDGEREERERGDGGKRERETAEERERERGGEWISQNKMREGERERKE